MNTTATNRKIRVLIKQLAESSLIPDPSFQRRLVWSKKHKLSFIETILLGLPFPEIYIAAGNVNSETGEGEELVVDGQQRLTTIREYFNSSDQLIYNENVIPYRNLSEEKKRAFLEYEVVVRDLGIASEAEIKEVFKRINSTRYALNAMEVHNARFEGRYKRLGERLAADEFFAVNRVFNTLEVRRMNDVKFCLLVITTMLSSYFRRDDELGNFLEKYNDDFPHEQDIKKRTDRVISYIWNCDFEQNSRVWKKTDLFTLMIEVDRMLNNEETDLAPTEASKVLSGFYNAIDEVSKTDESDPNHKEYYHAAIQASNDRSSRITRGKIIQNILSKAAQQPGLPS